MVMRIVHGYIWIIRCTPSDRHDVLGLYGLPEVLLGVFGIDINSWNRLYFVIIAVASVLGAMPGNHAFGLLGSRQYSGEAALSIGLTEAQAFRRIVLPQALVSALPNLGNSFILLMKEGALAYTIGIDIMGKGQLLIARNLRRVFDRDPHRLGRHSLADAGDQKHSNWRKTNYRQENKLLARAA